MNMADASWYPKEVKEIKAWLEVNQPHLSSSFQEVLDAEEKHNKYSHILYTIVIAGFNAGRAYQWNHPTNDPYQDG
jgi:hypothetical protein